MINYLALPMSFDIEKLQQDLSIVLELNWQVHFNKNDYEGNWDVIALRSLDGKAESIIPIAANMGKSYMNTPILEKCHYFKSIIDSFQCEVEAVRLLRLAPNSIIKEHTDKDLGYEFGEFRWHIPIQSNPKAIFYSNGELFHMTVGGLWYLNANLPHAVENLGSHDRIHLIIDGKRNKWTDDLFRQAGYDFVTEKKIMQAKRKTEIEWMIANFEQGDTTITQSLAQEWRQKLEDGDY
jgi:hypothetical protein